MKSPKIAHLHCWHIVECGKVEKCRKLDLDAGPDCDQLWTLGLLLSLSSSVKWENEWGSSRYTMR